MDILTTYFDPHWLATQLAQHYALNQAHCQLIKGTVRDVYAVWSEQGRFIWTLYRHRHRTEGEILAERHIADHLNRAGVLTAEPIQTTTGQALLKIDAPEGTRYGTLTRFIVGTPLSRTPTPAQARQYGMAVAGLHIACDALPPVDRPTWTFDHWVGASVAAFSLVVTHRPDDLTYLAELAAWLRPQLDDLPTTSAPAFGIVHGDVIPSNAIIADDGRLHLIDLDFLCYSWRMFDVATYLNEASFWSAGVAVANAFLDGYRAVRPILPAERQSIPLLQVAQHVASLGVPAQHINVWGSSYLNDALIDRLMTALKRSVAAVR